MSELRLAFKDPVASKDAGICNLKYWASFTKTGSASSSSASGSTVSTATSVSYTPEAPQKKDSLRTARSGTKGGAKARAVTTDEDADDSPPSSSPQKPLKKKDSKTSKKPKVKEEEEEEKIVVPEEEERRDEDFVDAPPRRRAKAKPDIVPEDEDPEDFWNGTSKSKTQEKKKEIKKLQQSLESMTINLRTSWRDDSVSNQQQRFAVMINDIAEVNAMPSACAGFRRIDGFLNVRVAFAIDLPADKASGCGIDPARWMFVEMSFPNEIYLASEPRAAKTLTVRQCPPMTNEEIVLSSKFTQFGLWWTIEQRLGEKLANDWEKITDAANKATRAATSGGSSGTPDAWAMLEILEWPASQLPIAMKALEEAKKDVKEAIQLVLEESWLETAKAEIARKNKKKKKKKEVPEGEEPKEELIEDAEFAPLPVNSRGTSSFLSDIIAIVKKLIDESPKYCPICGSPHPLELFKPIVCGNALCKFQFSNMGLGVDFESELIHSPDAVDLLITMTAHAVTGSHFEPFPHEVSTKVDGITHAMEKPQDIIAALRHCPSVNDMVEMAKLGSLRATLNSLHPLLYLLLRWIITSSRAHLHFLSSEDQIPQINSPVQFHLKSTPPEKEEKFYAAKKKYGSFYAWHGSASSNWHSILRNGLKNYSNSKHQVNGAVYGPGVYMAVDSGTSIGYSSRSQSPCWPHSRYPEDLIVLALCEVINEGEMMCTGNVHRPHCLHSRSAPYYRIEKDEYITTRYLFVVYDRNASVQAADLQKHIKSKQLLRSNRGGRKGGAVASATE